MDISAQSVERECIEFVSKTGVEKTGVVVSEFVVVISKKYILVVVVFKNWCSGFRIRCRVDARRRRENFAFMDSVLV